jgi:hypothetical protein
MKHEKQVVTIKREVIHTGQHCHPGCVGMMGFWCGFFRCALAYDHRTFASKIRCPDCRAATAERRSDG